MKPYLTKIEIVINTGAIFFGHEVHLTFSDKSEHNEFWPISKYNAYVMLLRDFEDIDKHNNDTIKELLWSIVEDAYKLGYSSGTLADK